MTFIMKFDRELSLKDQKEILRIFRDYDHLTLRERQFYVAIKFKASGFRYNEA